MPDMPAIPDTDDWPDDAIPARKAAAIVGIGSRQLLRLAQGKQFRSWVREHLKRAHPSRFYSESEIRAWVAARTRREH